MDFSIQRGNSTPICFVPVRDDGEAWPLKHIERAYLILRPIYGVPMKLELEVGSDGLRCFLEPKDTERLEWTTADYEVVVSVAGVVQTIYSGLVTLVKGVRT